MYICEVIKLLINNYSMKKYQENAILSVANPQFPRILNSAIHEFESVLAKRIFYCVQSQIKKSMETNINMEDYKNLWFEIPTFFIDPKARVERISKAADELQRAKFRFLDKEFERFNKIVPFPVVQYDKRWGHIRVKVEEEALPFLVVLSKGYYWFKLYYALLLSSKFSQKWYELFCEKKDIGNVTYEIEEIKEKLNVTGNYKGNFLDRVVYKAIQEVNEKTDLYIEYTPINNQKKPVLGYDFKITPQEKKGEILVYQRITEYYDKFQNMSPLEKSEYWRKLQSEYDFNANEFQKLMSDKYMRAAIVEADSKIESERVSIRGTKAQYMRGVIKKARLKKKEEIDEKNTLFLPFEEEDKTKTPQKAKFIYGSEKSLQEYADAKGRTIEDLMQELNLEKGENGIYYKILS